MQFAWEEAVSGAVGGSNGCQPVSMPTATYVYDLGEGVYIKPAYQNKVSGSFNAAGTTFILDQEVTGLTNATISISYQVNRDCG